MSLERLEGTSYTITERQRLEIRQAQREIEAEEQKRKEAEEAPIREAEKQLQRTVLELRALEKELVTSGRPDPSFVIPESVSGKRMSLSDAQRMNTAEALKFAENTPDFYPSQANRKMILDYLQAQKIAIADSATFRAAFERLSYLGLLEEKPEPEPEPQPEPEPELDPEVERLRRLEEYGTQIVLTHDGVGYTQKALDAMDSETFAKVNRIPRFSGVLFPERL